ncbi:phage head closure protein [Chromobacterium violaceum]|uniref:phage head closure protein n=1 Tax=Chromobacterium violaceum TaxID=536 RepID=UPI001E32D150|nr:phage head closure protein [Chromobacterium violaceum]MCD0494827.1 phage head closure protein [Chromobacterium violaceum]
MNASMLNGRIWLSWPVKTRKPSGQEVIAWSERKRIHARIEYLGARTYTAALAEQTGCSIRATIRRREVAHGWRALVNGQPFKVKTVQPHQEPGYFVLMLETSDGNG